MKSQLRSLILIATLIAANMASANEAVHHEAHGPVEIPWSSIIHQAGNLLILIVVLAIVLRKTIAQHFEMRRSTYLELVRKADAAKEEAEKSRREISQRLEALESSTQQSLSQATSEAEELRQRIVTEAKELSKKLTADAERASQLELERAKLELRRELLATALETARTTMKTSVGGAEQKKLQNEFVEKIQVVR